MYIYMYIYIYICTDTDMDTCLFFELAHTFPRVFPGVLNPMGRGDLWCENHGPHHGTLLCILGYIPLVDIEGVCTFFFCNQGIK